MKAFYPITENNIISFVNVFSGMESFLISMKKQIAKNGKIEIEELMTLINLSIKGDIMAVEQPAEEVYA
jgi:hypothetical protein